MKKEILTTTRLAVGYDKKAILSDITIRAMKGQMICLLGPNGAGKSTILRTISGLLAPIDGTVKIDGELLQSVSQTQLAKKRSLVLTDRVAPSMMTVQELVSMGRMPYTGLMGKLTDADKNAVRKALKEVDAFDLRQRFFTELSDGERQKVMIARALVQEPSLMILDEPTSHLDIRHKIEVIRILQRLTQEKGITCILSLHDIDFAIKNCHQVILIKKDRIVASGTPEEIFDGTKVQQLYQITGGVYHELLGMAEMMGKNGNDIFILGGSGCGIPVYRALSRAGYGLTAGVLHENDVEVSVAQVICSHVVTTTAFEPISDNALEEAKQYVTKASFVVDTGVPFGTGNIDNLKLLRIAQQLKKPIFTLRKCCPENMDERDVVSCNGIAELVHKIKAMMHKDCATEMKKEKYT